MKILAKILKWIFNPLYSIVTANEENKPILKRIKRPYIVYTALAILITAGIILAYYYHYIFGV